MYEYFDDVEITLEDLKNVFDRIEYDLTLIIITI